MWMNVSGSARRILRELPVVERKDQNISYLMIIGILKISKFYT